LINRQATGVGERSFFRDLVNTVVTQGSDGVALVLHDGVER
jgi:hypothetical protein